MFARKTMAIMMVEEKTERHAVFVAPGRIPVTRDRFAEFGCE